MQEKLFYTLKKHPYLSSFLLHLSLFGVIYSVFTPFYQTNDDVGMMLMVRGISIVTEPTEYILFMNILLGKLFKSLFLLYPDFDWYSFFMVSCLFASFTIIGGITLKSNDKINVLFYLTAFLLLGLPVVVQLQFTVIASVLAISGYFLLLKNPSVYERVIGVLIIILASFIRYESYLMTTILVLPLFLFEVHFSKQKRLILYPIIVGILAFALSQYSNYIHDQYDNCYTFNKYRAALAHYTFDQRIDENTKNQLLKNVGWSENDYKMFRHWFFTNDTIYNVEKFKYLLDNSPQTNYVINNLFRIRSYFFLYDIIKSPFCISALAVTIIFVLLSNFSRKITLFYLFFWAYVFIVIVGIRYTMKAPPERVLMPMFLLLGVLPVFFQNTFAFIGKRYSFIRYILAGSAFFTSCFYMYSLNYDYSATAIEHNKAFKTFIEENNMNEGKNLYVVLATGLPMDYILPFEDLSYLKKLDIFWLSCFQQFTHQCKVLDKYQIEDVYLALINRENVYLAIYAPSNEIELISAYMREHYSIEVKSKEIASLGQRIIIKLSKL